MQLRILTMSLLLVLLATAGCSREEQDTQGQVSETKAEPSRVPEDNVFYGPLSKPLVEPRSDGLTHELKGLGPRGGRHGHGQASPLQVDRPRVGRDLRAYDIWPCRGEKPGRARGPGLSAGPLLLDCSVAGIAQQLA